MPLCGNTLNQPFGGRLKSTQSHPESLHDRADRYLMEL